MTRAPHNWPAVLAVNEPLAARDPAQADPDRLATTARQQLHRQQKAEQASRPQKAIALLRKSRRRRTAALGGLAAVLALTLLVLTLPLWARDTSRLVCTLTDHPDTDGGNAGRSGAPHGKDKQDVRHRKPIPLRYLIKG